MTYIFFREGGWYPIDGIEGDYDALVHIAHNPGTLKVERADGLLVWDQKHGKIVLDETEPSRT